MAKQQHNNYISFFSQYFIYQQANYKITKSLIISTIQCCNTKSFTKHYQFLPAPSLLLWGALFIIYFFIYFLLGMIYNILTDMLSFIKIHLCRAHLSSPGCYFFSTVSPTGLYHNFLLPPVAHFLLRSNIALCFYFFQALVIPLRLFQL